jgi:hypothetical protein
MRPDELAGLLKLVAAQPGVHTVTIGHSRDAGARAAAAAFAEAWTATGGVVLDAVDWPETAASWLRQARRFVAGAPDAWVVIATPAGWSHLADRLRLGTGWDPARTFGFTEGRLGGPG